MFILGGFFDGTKFTPVNKAPISPGSAEWTRYFGTLTLDQLRQFFPPSGSGTWSFPFLNPLMLQLLLNMKTDIHGFFGGFTPGGNTNGGFGQITIPSNSFGMAQIPFNLFPQIQQGLLAWVDQGKLDLLKGGTYKKQLHQFVAKDGTVVTPSSPKWKTYFGTATVQQIETLVPTTGQFDVVVGWLYSPQIFQLIKAMSSPGFKWGGVQPAGSITIPSGFQGGQLIPTGPNFGQITIPGGNFGQVTIPGGFTTGGSGGFGPVPVPFRG